MNVMVTISLWHIIKYFLRNSLMQRFALILDDNEPGMMHCVNEQVQHLQVDVSIGQSIQAWPAPLCIVDQQLFHSLYLPQPAAIHMHSVAKYVSFSGHTRVAVSYFTIALTFPQYFCDTTLPKCLETFHCISESLPVWLLGTQAILRVCIPLGM